MVTERDENSGGNGARGLVQPSRATIGKPVRRDHPEQEEAEGYDKAFPMILPSWGQYFLKRNLSEFPIQKTHFSHDDASKHYAEMYNPASPASIEAEKSRDFGSNHPKSPPLSTKSRLLHQPLFRLQHLQVPPIMAHHHHRQPLLPTLFP